MIPFSTPDNLSLLVAADYCGDNGWYDLESLYRLDALDYPSPSIGSWNSYITGYLNSSTRSRSRSRSSRNRSRSSSSSSSSRSSRSSRSNSSSRNIDRCRSSSSSSYSFYG